LISRSTAILYVIVHSPASIILWCRFGRMGDGPRRGIDNSSLLGLVAYFAQKTILSR
jgi:hypothetical protein